MQPELIEAVKTIKWKSKYKCADGSIVIGIACTQVSQELRDMGWRRVPRIDEYDLRQAGFKTALARYAGGASETRGKECYVVVLN